MARSGPRRINRYTEQFKATAVKLSSLPGVLIHARFARFAQDAEFHIQVHH